MQCKVTDSGYVPPWVPNSLDFQKTLIRFKGDYDEKLIHTRRVRRDLDGNYRRQQREANGRYKS